MLELTVRAKTVASRLANFAYGKRIRAQHFVCHVANVRTVPKSVLRRPLFITALVVVAIDLATKVWAVANLENKGDIEVLGSFLKFSFLRNPGAAFSVGTNITWVFTIISIAVSVAILLLAKRVTNRIWAIALGGMLGGALGNLGDRIFRSPEPFQGHVVDFILLPNYPMFNISDSAVVIAAITMTILSIRGVEYSAPGISSQPKELDES